MYQAHRLPAAARRDHVGDRSRSSARCGAVRCSARRVRRLAPAHGTAHAHAITRTTLMHARSGRGTTASSAEPAAAGSRAAELITTTLLFISMILSWIAFVQVGFGQDAHVTLITWITSGDLKVDWALRIDTLTAVMLVVVTTVSALVHLYSIGYMAEDPYRPRFFCYLSLFTFAMLMLVTADNLVQLFFGWEGVGLDELSADRLLVPEAGSERGRDQGLHRQPRRRFRLRARHLRRLHDDRRDRLRHRLRAGAVARRQDHPFPRLATSTR